MRRYCGELDERIFSGKKGKIHPFSHSDIADSAKICAIAIQAYDTVLYTMIRVPCTLTKKTSKNVQATASTVTPYEEIGHDMYVKPRIMHRAKQKIENARTVIF